MQTSLKAITATALIGIGTLSLPLSANAGWGCGWGCGWGSALAGFGVGALVGSALAAPPVYVVPPDYYYGAAGYGYYYYGPAGYLPDYGPTPPTPSWHGTRSYPHSNAPSHGAALPKAKTSDPTSSEQKIATRFKAAQAKAKRDGVDALTKQDIEGLSAQQLKQLRGY